MPSHAREIIQWEMSLAAERGLREKAQALLETADIQINGGRDWDIHIRDPRWYVRVLGGGSLALGESYMDGWWDCKALDQFFCRLIEKGLDNYESKGVSLFFLKHASKLLNRQSRERAFVVGEKHYDIGNDLFQAMLDKRMTYTCGFWASANNLNDAQEDKLEMVCQKLGLKKGQKILDVGCGWGSFMKYAAQKYKVECVGITVSREQMALGREMCQGLPVSFKLLDYRDVEGSFDHVVSLGMFEHVGWKNYRVYMEKVHSALKPGGSFLLQSIGSNRSVHHCDAWFDKYIFPNGMLPSIQQIGGAIEGLFVMEDWHNFGTDYEKTLMAWFSNFDHSWKKLNKRYDERFYRMWKYYLHSLAGGFKARRNQLWQVLLSKGGVRGGYRRTI